MTDLTKLTKAQLIEVIEKAEENKFDNFKEEFSVNYSTEQEWITFLKSLSSNYLKATEELKVRNDYINQQARKAPN